MLLFNYVYTLDIHSTKLQGIIQSSRGNVTCEKWHLVRDSMKDDVGLTTMNTRHIYSLFFFPSFTVNWDEREQPEGKWRTTFRGSWVKICRGFSSFSVKSYDNRSVKRVRCYFIITDCTQTSVHYAHPFPLSFSFSFSSYPSPLFFLPLSLSLSLLLSHCLTSMYIYSYYGIKGKGW